MTPTKFNSSVFEPLKNYATEVLTECKRVRGPVAVEQKDLSWIVNVQKDLNTYVDKFQRTFAPNVRTVSEECQLSQLQAGILVGAQNKLKGKLDAEEFFPKLLEAFAVHNRHLAEVWEA